MSNKFGARVIGKTAAKQQQAVEKARANHFGPRVIGKVLADREAVEQVEKDSRADPARRIRERQQAAEAAAKQRAEARAREAATAKGDGDVVEAPITANLDELAEALENNHGFYETLYLAELQREGGPRKGALRLFLAHELEHDKREDRQAEIEELLQG